MDPCVGSEKEGERIYIARSIEQRRDRRRGGLFFFFAAHIKKKKKTLNPSWLAITKFDASPTLFYAWASKAGLKGVAAAWPTPFNAEAWTYLAAFGFLQAALQLLLPGKKVTGPVTPRGNVPVYYANGVLSYFVTLALLGGTAVAGIWRPERVYDVFGEMLSSLNAFSLLLCLALWAKVRKKLVSFLVLILFVVALCSLFFRFLLEGRRRGNARRKREEKKGRGKRKERGVTTKTSKTSKKKLKKKLFTQQQQHNRATSPPPPPTRAPRAPSSTTTTGAWSSTLAFWAGNSTSRRGQTAGPGCAAGRFCASASPGSSFPCSGA